MDEISSADSSQKSKTPEQLGVSVPSGNVAALPAVVLQPQGPRTSNMALSGQIVAIQGDVNPKPAMSAVSVSLASTGVNASGIRVSGSPGVKYITMQNLMRLQVAASGAQTATAPTLVSAQRGQISQMRLTAAPGSQVAPLSLPKGNFIIGNRIVQCIVPNSSAVAQTNSLSGKNSVTLVQTNSDSNMQLKVFQSTQNNVVSSGQPVSSISTISVAPSPRALAGNNVRMSAVLPSNLVRTILAANMSSTNSQHPRAVITAVGNPVQQQQKLAVQQQSGAVTVQIVRPSASVQAGTSMQAGSIQCLTTPQVAIAGSTVGTLRLPTSAVQLRAGTPQKKIVLVSNQTGNSGGGNVTYLTTSSGQSQNKVGQQMPITLLASPNSGTGNVRYIAIRGGVPVQMSSASSTSNAVSIGTRIVAPAMNVTLVSQASSGNTVALEGGNIIQTIASGSKINVHDYLKKVKEQQKKIAPLQDKTVLTLAQQPKGGIQVMSSKSLQVIQQQPTLATVKSSTSGQMGQGPTIYIITNNNSTSSLTAVSGSSQLVQTKALSISSGLGTTAIRPKIVTVGSGTRTIQVVTREDGSQATSTTVPVFVDGQPVKLTKAQQNQKKANRILAEAIAKAQAEGIELDTSDIEGKRKKKRKADAASEDEPVATKKKREARPRGSRTPRRGGKKTEKSGSGDEAGDGLGNALDEFEVGNESDKSRKRPNASGKPSKKKKRPLPTFLKNKKRKRAKDESDVSDVDLGTPVASILDGEDSLQMRRSARVVKRKKYVDDLDLNLSEDESNDAEKTSELAADDCDGLPSTLPQKELFEDNPAEEDAQIVEKILGMRVGKRKISSQPLAANQKIEAADMDLEVDVECSDEKRETDRRHSLSENVKDVEVEEFYVKYKNYSFLHCEWRTADELLVGDKRILMKIKRFKLKRAHNPFFNDVDEEDMFNPDYVEVDRILDVAVTVDPVTSENVTHYLVTWRSLPYEDATWELEQDVDQTKINMFLKLREPPTEAECKYKPKPSPKEWKALSDTLTYYKNSNILREYQLEGLNWLTFSYYNRQNCILADEMGLGKTIQSITFLHEVYEYGIRGPFLIIVPLSTVGNWQREFEAWTDINVIVYHGSMASRNMLRQYEMYYLDDKGQRRTDVYKFHALITTYEVIISDFEELSQIDWRVAVIDEAHRLKNRNCKLLQGLACFELEHRVLLTGTPLQNNVDELFSLLSFLEPRQFSSSEAFMAEFGKLETESQVDKLKALLKPMMLRRLKEDVEKSLAPKEETIVEVELTNMQKKYYRAILERNFSFLAKGGSTANIPNLMNTMMELRKCCNHPYLINGAEEQILEELMVTRGETEKLCQTMIQASGKLVLVDKLLPKLKADGHKVLIFSQMIRVLDIIEDYLLHKHYIYERIDGRIRGNLRQEAIDRFSKPESDRFVFLLCTRAGGLGINLTAADTVIIFDSDWNPQNDLQAQARCHRIGQLKAVKVYRLITRNTYEKEMFDRASLKLGLDKAVLQSMGNKEVNMQNQLSKKEIEDLLKKGAYGALMDDDNAGEEFCEEDIEHILQRRTQVIQIEAGVKGSTFAKASFNLSTNRSDIEIDDPNFWQKWAKKADMDLDEALHRNDLIMDLPRQRKVTARYGKQDNIVNMSELDTSNSESDDGENLSTGGAGGGGVGRRSGKRRKKGKSSRGFDDSIGKVKCYTRSDCFKVEKNLLVYGWGRWQDILLHGRFKHRLGVDDVITITRAMLVFSLQHYDGDDRIKKFIFDLISPSEDGQEKDYKNHTGLSAPVPRGRKGKKVKKDVVKKAQFDEDLTKLDIDLDSILVDEGYKKHLKRQSNKVLLRVRLLYYLKQEVIGRQAEKIFSGAPASEIDVPVLCADVDIPIYWWDSEADRCLLVGVFKHGYEKYNQMRQDQKLCFLSRCGPPDGRALLAEQNDDDDLKDEEEEEEPKPRRRGRKKKEKKTKKASNCDDLDESGCFTSKSCLSKDGGLAENGKLPFPSASDLNTRFRRIITSFQRSHKQGMLKLEQVAKKMHRREQMKEGALNLSEQYIAPTDLQSMHLEGVGGNPLLLAEQLNWTRREEADFYRVVSTFGVERDCATGQFIWDNFRNLGRLERKLDDTLTEYFKAFYHMCMKVCDRFRSEEEARPPNGLYVMPITAERANRCLARIDLLSKIREQILWHPRLDERLSLCQSSSYFPDWWICGLHDKDLLVGAAKHGVSRTDEYILKDPQLSFYKYAKMHADQNVKDEVSGVAVSESCPSSPQAFGNSDAADGSQRVEAGMKVNKEDIKEEEKPKEEIRDVLVKMEKDDESKAVIDSVKPNDTERGNTSVLEDVKDEMDARAPDNGPTDSPKHPGINDDEEGGLACVRRFNNQWPKDRIVFHRLENICYCVELGRWKVSQRHHANSQLQVMDSSCNTPNAGMSLPGTPVGGGHDYTIVPDEQVDSFKFKLQKRRRRRTKAEIEAGLSDDKQLDEDADNTKPHDAIGSTGYLKKKRGRKMQSLDLMYDVNDDPDGHVSVVNQLDGSRLSGDEAPTQRELSAWLDEHPDYVVEKQLLHSEAPIQRQNRRPRLDPSKLVLEDLTGDENVAVVNRNTGKRITGVKAPTLRHLGPWLVRNPGFDIDPKWAHIVRQMGSLPEELSCRIAAHSGNSSQPKSVAMPANMSSEELYKTLYMARLAAMADQPRVVSYSPVKSLSAVEQAKRAIYAASMTGMGLLPGSSRHDDDDSSSESHDSSSPKPSTSAFLIPSSLQQEEEEEEEEGEVPYSFICDPGLYSTPGVHGVRRPLVAHPMRQQQQSMAAGFHLEQRRNHPANMADTDSDPGNSLEMGEVSDDYRFDDGLALGASAGSRMSENVRLRLASSPGVVPSIGHYVQPGRATLNQGAAWESNFGTRLKASDVLGTDLAVASQEIVDESSDSSDDEFADD